MIIEHMRYFLLLLSLLTCLAAPAQNSKRVKELQRQRDKLQQDLKRSQQELDRTRQDITTRQRATRRITEQLETKLNGIRDAELRMTSLDSQMVDLQDEVNTVDAQLQIKKDKYACALRMARAYRHVKSHTLFVLSGRTLMQMSRRARNTNFFASILRIMGEELISKQSQLLSKQNDLLKAKSEMNSLMQQVMVQRHELGVQQIEQQRQLATLDDKQRGLQSQVSKQRTQLAELNRKIDQVVAAEIEAARKRAEEARRREEARRKAQAGKGGKGGSSGKPGKAGKPGSSGSTSPAGIWLTAEDKALNGSLEQNRGRLPVPLTGSYMLGERFGIYNVPGMNNVQLDNKGVNYIGKSGARARSIFDGEVTAVFQFYGTKGVLVRHGSYISVYCNLSSVIVSRGQKVHARDILGTIATNSEGKCILHFQLRKETTKLNPESWIGR